jgi:hypothetical protein
MFRVRGLFLPHIMAADTWRPDRGKKGKKGHATLCGRTVCTFVLCLQRLRRDSRHIIWRESAMIWFLSPFGDVGRSLVYLAPLCRGDTSCYTVSLSHAGTPPPLLPALHVPHRDRCCDAPPEPRNRDILRPLPRSDTTTTPPLPGRGRPVAPAGMGHALACLAGPAGSGGSGDRGAPGQTSGASTSSDD